MSAVLNAPQLQSVAKTRRAHQRSVVFMRWLRKVHLWVGLWGAALGCLFGTTGIVLNHRTVLKIPVTKTVQNSAQLALPPETRTMDAIAAWLQNQLQFDGVQVRSKAEPAQVVSWAGREVPQPARWTFNFISPYRSVNAEYYVGNRFVKVDTVDATLIGVLTRLHMATGANVFWVLVSDTIAAGLVVLCITGLLLWSRLHKVRLIAVIVSLGAMVGAVGFLLGTAA